MTTLKIKTSELIGPALDWAVAKREYDELAAKNIQYPQYAKHYPKISPSTDWALAGPIIERQKIRLSVEDNGTWWAERRLFDDGHQAYATSYDKATVSNGPTPLIAAMRCYVASKLGDEVEVPEELV